MANISETQSGKTCLSVNDYSFKLIIHLVNSYRKNDSFKQFKSAELKN